MAWSNEIKSKLYDITKGTNINYNGATVQEIFANNAEFDTSIACDVFKNVEIGRKVFNSTDDTRYYRFPTDDDNYYSNGNLYVCTGVLNNNERNSKTMYQWGYGELDDISDSNIIGHCLRIGNIKTNDFCTRCVVSKVNAETGSTTNVTLDDLLNPSDNYYIKLNPYNSITSYVNDNGTLNSNVLSIQPFLVFDNYNSMLTAFSLTSAWNLGENTYKNGASYASTTSTTIAYTNKSKNDGFKYIFTSVKADSVDTENVTVWKNDYVILTSTITKTSSTTTQTITGGINLKFFVKLLQSMGCYICVDSLTDTWTADYFKTNENVLIGELDKDGKPTYNWLTAEQRLTSKSPNLDSEWSNENNPYTPRGNDKPVKDDIVPTNYRVSDQIGGFTMYYKCNQSDLLTLVRSVNFPTEEHPIPDGFEFLPHLVSCTQYPFNVSQYASGTTDNITIGSWNSGVAAINLNSTQFAVQTIADFTLPGLNGDFTDYSPYTQYQLFIPLCGWVDLTDNCVNKHITVELATDVINNGCVSTVKADGCPVVHKTGIMGTSIAISATENGLKQATLTQSVFNTVGAVTATGYALATGNAIGVVNGLVNTAGTLTQGNIANNSNYTRQTGSTGDKSNNHISNTCYLKISSVVASEPNNYAHTVGYMCNKTKQISQCTGYTVCSNVDTSGLTCNQSAKDRIKRMLETGIYI